MCLLYTDILPSVPPQLFILSQTGEMVTNEGSARRWPRRRQGAGFHRSGLGDLGEEERREEERGEAGHTQQEEGASGQDFKTITAGGGGAEAEGILFLFRSSFISCIYSAGSSRSD